MENKFDFTVKAFITNLGKYNEGYLVGEWVTFPITEEEEKEILKRIGIDNNYYEEIFFTDYDSDLDLYGTFGEYPTIDQLNELAETIDSMSDYERKVYLAVCEKDSYWVKHIDEFNPDNYGLAEDITAEEYEEQLFWDTCTKEMRDLLESNYYITIDFEQMARDDDYITETSFGVLYEC